jgi:hypothetical protein
VGGFFLLNKSQASKTQDSKRLLIGAWRSGFCLGFGDWNLGFKMRVAKIGERSWENWMAKLLS